jgi:hypothetical protein
VKRYGLVETVTGSLPEYYMYSSYGNYITEGGRGVVGGMVKPERVLRSFKTSALGKKHLRYRNFVEDKNTNWGEVLGDLVIEKL